MAKLIEQDLTFAETAPVLAEGTGLVVGTPAEVWAVLLDYERWPTWFVGVKQCRATSEPATGLGSTREVVLNGGASFQERFIGWEDEALWSFTVTETSLPVVRSVVERATITEFSPGRTRVTYRMALDPKPALKPFAPLLTRAISRNLTKAMTALGREVHARR